MWRSSRRWRICKKTGHGGLCAVRLRGVHVLLTDSTSAAVLSLSETEDEAALYDYDVWNNMISSTVDGETTTYVYNGDSLRVSKTANDLTTRYAYEYTEVVLELDGSGNQKAMNVRGHKLLSRVTSAGSSWFMYNGHGDVTALVDGANTVQATYYYDAFGVHREQTGTADNPYRYSGYTFAGRERFVLSEVMLLRPGIGPLHAGGYILDK
jgi:YD repeat-containing protein